MLRPSPQEREAERAVHVAALVACVLGLLSLGVGVATWRERRYLDLEVLLGLVESVVVLGLGAWLPRRPRPAAPLLLGTSALGGGYALWSGLPWLALLPYALASLVFLRALRAARHLRTRRRATPPPAGAS